jgi:cell wall-associated NlpC family hydrolase
VADYENGGVSYLAVLFQATSWEDLLNRYSLLSEVTHVQAGAVYRVQQLEQQLAQQKQEQQAAFQKLQEQTQQLQSIIASHQQLVQRANAKVNTVSRDASLRASIEADLENRIHYTKRQIEQIQQQTAKDVAKMNSKSYVSNAEKALSSVDASSLIQYALTLRGIPYVYGGESPATGFDCSGFTTYVFRHFGITLPRKSEYQFGIGVPVSANHLKPGDLVFFHTIPNSPGASHVGIYIGHGQMINAEVSGGVRVSQVFSPYYWASRYIGARDVIRH